MFWSPSTVVNWLLSASKEAVAEDEEVGRGLRRMGLLSGRRRTDHFGSRSTKQNASMALSAGMG